MRKLIILFLLALPFIGAAQTQSPTFGIKGGANLANFTGANTDGLDYKWGFNAGLITSFPLNNQLSLQPELLYSQKGAKATSNSKVAGYTYDYSSKNTLHYFDVPVLLHYNANGFFVEAGPQFGLLLRATSRLESSVTDTKNVTKQSTDSRDITNSYRVCDFGYVGGLGYQNPSGALVGVRYNGGFISNTNSATVRNSVFQAYIGFLFKSK